MKRAAMLLALGLTACEDFTQLALQKPHAVIIRWNDVSRTPDGTEVSVARPAASLDPCRVWVDGSFDAGWSLHEGRWEQDGLCVIHDVPPGRTLAQRQPDEAFIEISVDEVDFGRDFFGRSTEIAREGTTVTFDVSSADPLEKPAYLDVYLPAFGTGLASGLAGSNPAVGAPTGSTGSTSFPVTVKWTALPLLREGEPARVFQAKRTAFASGYAFLLSKQGTASVVPTDTRTVRTSVTLAPIDTGPVRLPALPYDPKAARDDIDLDLLGAEFQGTWIKHQALIPGAVSGLDVQSRFDIDPASRSVSLPESNVDPLPGTPWTGRASVELYFALRFGSVDSPPTGTLGMVAFEHGPASDLGWIPSTLMTPPRNIDVPTPDGGFSGLTFDTLTPVVKWEAPRRGIPNRYVVNIYEAKTEGDEYVFEKLPASFNVFSPECHIPPGVLQTAKLYVFSVIAENCTSGSAERPAKLNLQTTCGASQNMSYLMFSPFR